MSNKDAPTAKSSSLNEWQRHPPGAQPGNYTATARQLHLSVRAVTYRLDRIKALSGYHPGERTQRFTLHTAVVGAKLLGWPDPPHYTG